MGNLVTSWGGGFGLERKDAIKEVSRIAYSAVNHKINLPDAIHLMYATPSEVDVIVSNDETFNKNWDKVPKALKRHIELMTSEQVLNKHQRELAL